MMNKILIALMYSFYMCATKSTSREHFLSLCFSYWNFYWQTDENIALPL